MFITNRLDSVPFSSSRSQPVERSVWIRNKGPRLDFLMYSIYIESGDSTLLLYEGALKGIEEDALFEANFDLQNTIGRNNCRYTLLGYQLTKRSSGKTAFRLVAKAQGSLEELSSVFDDLYHPVEIRALPPENQR